MMHHYTKFSYKTKILLTVQKYLLDKARHTARQTDRCLLDKARHMARQTDRCLLDKARHTARQTGVFWTKPDTRPDR